jgi:hypothetical protein
LTKYFEKCKSVHCSFHIQWTRKGVLLSVWGGGVCVSLCVCVSDDVTGVQGVMLGRVILWVCQWNRVPLCTR